MKFNIFPYRFGRIFFLFILISVVIIAFLGHQRRQDVHRTIETHVKEGTPEEWNKAFSKAIDKADDDSKLYAGRAKANYDMGEYQAALRDINSAIEKSPGASGFYTARARIHEVMGLDPQAAKDRNTALHKKKADESALGSIILNHWASWMIVLFFAVFVSFMLKFGVQNLFLEEDELSIIPIFITNAVTLVVMGLAFIYLSNIAPAWEAKIFVWTIYFFTIVIVGADLRNIYESRSIERPLGHWNCPTCDTENTLEHIQCWHCGRNHSNS